MQERKEYPAGVPSWVDTSQPDPEAAVEFYSGLFGWECENQMPEGDEGRYYFARLRGKSVAAIGSKAPNEPPGATWNTYVGVEDADASARAVTQFGGQVLAGPFDIGEAGRVGVFADPAGAVFCSWEAGGTPGAELVNEPGTWNFSALNTADPAGAERFYNAVYGWEVTPFGAADGGGSYFRMPGYGDFLEKLNPGTRERNAQMGAPDRFEDAVALLVPSEDTPHWGVTFSVDDADRAAERARELGGEVLVEPMDAPWVRMTVLQDPQGAVFTASKFVPPS